ncbi:MAG: glycosyltransferase family 25 protein [Paracoccaceae bacterium]|nr:glycosyltransferase family 25 protein [Paracoccaceae bacterium]MDE2674621.1 glycosyltransferase family 25 protein [Paracoccaceae bacterium]
MRCIVINLKRAVGRKQYITNQLNQVQQNYEIVEGMDWKDISPSQLSYTARNIRIKSSFRSLTRGQIGCNLSHRKILKWLASSSEKMIAVLEDDVKLSKDFPDVLNILESTPHKFDIVFLGSTFRKDQLVNLVPLNNQYNLSLSTSREGGAWGYVITQKAAEKFLNKLPEITGPIDDALYAFHAHGLKTFTLNPQIVFHEEEAKFSFNNEENVNKRIYLKEELIRIFPSFLDRYSRKYHLWKRIRSEKII